MIWSNSCNGIYLECPFENKFPTVWGLFLGGCWVLFLKGSLETYSKGSSWNKLVSICLHTGFPALTSSSPLKGTGDPKTIDADRFPRLNSSLQYPGLQPIWLPWSSCIFKNCLMCIHISKREKNPPLQTDSERQAAG